MRLPVILILVACFYTIFANRDDVRSFYKINYNPTNFKNIFKRNIQQSSIAGLHPDDVKKYYGFPTSNTAGEGKTIAIVDPFDSPTIESDLAVFSTTFNLPQCTSANGCFMKVNSVGGTTFPGPDFHWSLETSLDVQWAHAIAPGANIVLVIAQSTNYLDMFSAVNYAKTIADYVSMSWGLDEQPAYHSFESTFIQYGVSFFAASGDVGGVVTYPSSSINVIAVGGTSLTFLSNGSIIETGWSGSGGGCSTINYSPSAQSNYAGYASTGCGIMKAVPDTSLLADATVGVAVYDSYNCSGNCWYVLGGTSAATPMVTGRATISNLVIQPSTIYGTGFSSSPINFRDIVSGKAGNNTCKVGFDLVTGLGSWKDPNSTITVGPIPPPVSSGVTIAIAWLVACVCIVVHINSGL
jgi:subtilase family serine protease